MTSHDHWFKLLEHAYHWKVLSSTCVCNVHELFSAGADVPGMPVASLMRVVSGASEEPQAMRPYCVAGDYIIVEKLWSRKGTPSICFGGSSWHWWWWWWWWWWWVSGAMVLSRKIPWSQHESWSQKAGVRHLFVLVPSGHHPSWGVGAATTIIRQSWQNSALGVWARKWFTNPIQGFRPDSGWTSDWYHRAPDVKHHPRKLVQGPPLNDLMAWLAKEVLGVSASLVGFVVSTWHLSMTVGS